MSSRDSIKKKLKKQLKELYDSDLDLSDQGAVWEYNSKLQNIQKMIDDEIIKENMQQFDISEDEARKALEKFKDVSHSQTHEENLRSILKLGGGKKTKRYRKKSKKYRKKSKKT